MTSLTELISIDQTANKQRHSVEESTITPRTVQALTETCSLGDLEDAILSRHGDKANKLLTRECFTKAVHSMEQWDTCQVADSNCQYDTGTQTCSTKTAQGHVNNIEDDSSVLFWVGVRIKHNQCFPLYFYTYIGRLLYPIVTFVTKFKLSLHRHVGSHLQKSIIRYPRQTIGLLSVALMADACYYGIVLVWPTSWTPVAGGIFVCEYVCMCESVCPRS